VQDTVTEQANIEVHTTQAAGENAMETEVATAEAPIDLEEIFHTFGVGSDRLKIMSQCELKVFAHQAENENQLSANVRCELLSFCGFLLELLGAKVPHDWFKVVVLFDILAARIPMALKDLPTRCAAIVSIVRKMDTSEFHSWLTVIGPHATQLANSLRAHGAAIPDVVTEKSIFYQEKQVLGALGWQVEHASCETWISAFCTRLNVIERGSLSPSIQWVWQTSISYARRICMLQPATKIMTPRCLAQGLFGLCAVMAHLVSYSHLRPDQIELRDWLQMFGSVTMPMTDEMQVLNEMSLLVATDTNLTTLKQDTHSVLILLKDAKKEQQPLQ